MFRKKYILNCLRAHTHKSLNFSNLYLFEENSWINACYENS